MIAHSANQFMGRFILVLLTLLVGCNPSYAQPDSIIAIKTSRLFDSHLGQVIMGKKIILIEKGTITDIGADIAIPKQAQITYLLQEKVHNYYLYDNNCGLFLKQSYNSE